MVTVSKLATVLTELGKQSATALASTTFDPSICNHSYEKQKENIQPQVGRYILFVQTRTHVHRHAQALPQTPRYRGCRAGPPWYAYERRGCFLPAPVSAEARLRIPPAWWSSAVFISRENA